ncbi:MAG: hypothetical protein ACOCXA_04600 [Planctomycetota bacterium]
MQDDAAQDAVRSTTVLIRAGLGPGVGVGHYMRMQVLAQALRDAGEVPLICVDDPLHAAHLPQPVPVIGCGWAGSEADAEGVIERLAAGRVHTVVVDDYRLGAQWEARVQAAGPRVLAMDDLRRPHDARLVVDMKWRGAETATAYEGLLAADATALLGPAYAIIDPAIAACDMTTAGPFRVLVTLGGGGDGRLLAGIADALLERWGADEGPIEVLGVMGPLMERSGAVTELAQCHAALRPIDGAAGLLPLYRQAHLAVCAAGGTIYELLAARIPAVSFPLVPNQDNDPVDLAVLGHAFHLPVLHRDELDGLAELVVLMRRRHEELRAAIAAAPLAIDGQGARRIAAAITDSDSPAVSVAPVQMPREAAGEELGNGYRIRPVGLLDAPHYLASRNLPANRDRMVVQEDIRHIDHYRWWLHNERQSFLLSRHGRSVLYIWHRLVTVEGGPWLIGGWFVCGDHAGHQDALLALQWQLSHCRGLHPGVSWIAVIHRSNRYVRALNTWLGWSDCTADDLAAQAAIRVCWPAAHPEEFHHVRTRD